MNDRPMISCLCVTQKKPDLLKRAIYCYRHQTYLNKQIVIVYEETDLPTCEFIDRQQFAGDFKTVKIGRDTKLTVGELRNIGIREADGSYVCQWDDDDWYDADRLTEQMNFLALHDAAGCVFPRCIMFDEHTQKAYLSRVRLWENSILCKREVMLQHPYPPLSKGEGIDVAGQLYTQGELLLMKDMPQLYVYTFNGNSTWDCHHFKANLDRDQELSASEMRDLKEALSEYLQQDQDRLKGSMGILSNVIKRILPYGIIILFRRCKAYLNFTKKNRHFDIILSVGAECRPAYYLKKYDLRVCKNPLDWMSCSLDTVVHLHRTKFNDFFVDFVEDKQRSLEMNNPCYIDIKNNILAIHEAETGRNNREFRKKTADRFEILNSILLNANKICFISARNESMDVFKNFLKSMAEQYSGNMTYINIRNNESFADVSYTKRHKEKTSKKMELIEYEFYDIHPDGDDSKINTDAWTGNYVVWDNIMKGISVKKQSSFLSNLLNSKMKTCKAVM